MYFSNVGPVAFLGGASFALRAHSRLGTQKPLLKRIFPHIRGED